jgi:hypothetical protein
VTLEFCKKYFCDAGGLQLLDGDTEEITAVAATRLSVKLAVDVEVFTLMVPVVALPDPFTE